MQIYSIPDRPVAQHNVISIDDPEFLKDVPQPLYKYRVWDDKCGHVQYGQSILTQKQVYFAAAEQFNDPFDAALPFRYDPNDLTPENIFLKLIEVGRREMPGISEYELQQRAYERQHSGDFESGEYWKSHFPQFRKDINNRFGILSLTSKNDNLLMWSHYADSHRGYCVGMNKYTLYKSCGGTFIPAIYNDQIPYIPLFDTSSQTLTPLLATKSRVWEYEDEYRIIKSNGSKVAVEIPPEAIMEIVLGCNMAEEHKDAIFSLAKQEFPEARIFEARRNDEEFRLDLIPILQP